jgi:hypothetical protein
MLIKLFVVVVAPLLMRGSSPPLLVVDAAAAAGGRRPAAATAARSSAAEDSSSGGGPPTYDPHADPKSVILCDSTSRITALSPLLVRVELSLRGRFEDRASLAFVNRRLPVPSFSVRNATDWCNISLAQSGMTLSYRKTRSKSTSLTDHMIHVRGADGHQVWAATAHPDDTTVTPPQNLGGTTYDLKGQNGSLCGREMIAQGICAPGTHIDLTCGGNVRTFGDGASYCTAGVLTMAQGGATMYDDSWNTVRESSANGEWWESRQPARQADLHSDAQAMGAGNQDIYIFLHGTDHRAGLRNLAAVTGRAAVPPRRFFGVWWSRWNKYSTQELKEMATTYEDNDLPLDGINMDTEWHRNQVGYLDGTGANWYSGIFDWDNTLYPSPPALMDWLEQRGLWPVWMDVHQSSGVAPNNSQFAQFARRMGLPTDHERVVPPDMGNATFVEAFFELLNGQSGGRNYWWPDNGYGTALSSAHGLNRVLWDRIQFTEHVDPDTVGRPSVFLPFGGLGSGRMPIGHSGDIVESWQTLQWLPYFSATASNVLYSYIAHDIGGHRDYGNGNNPELYVRFTQYGAFSAQLRPHAAKKPASLKQSPLSHDKRFDHRVWEYPYKFYNPMRSAMKLRAKLVPYLYTAAMRAWLTPEQPFLRGVYVDFPADTTAVKERQRGAYLLGSSFMIQPVLTPVALHTNLTSHYLHFPSLPADPTGAPVAWVERDSGRCFLGGETLTNVGYRLEETAEFVRPGSMIPLAPTPTARWEPRHYSNTTVPACAAAASAVASCVSKNLAPSQRSDILKRMAPPPPALLGAASRTPCTVEWHVYLGNSTIGSGELLEDDGISTTYQQHQPDASGGEGLARTVANYSLDDSTMHVQIGPQQGSYPSAPTHRWLSIAIHNVLMPNTVRTPTGEDLIQLGQVSWDSNTLTASIDLGAVDVGLGDSVQIGWNGSPRSQLLCRSGHIGWQRLQRRVMDIKKAIDWEVGVGTQPSKLLNRLVGTVERMQETPEIAELELRSYDERVASALKMHTTPTEKHGLPTPGLQAVMQAWLRTRE